MAEQFLSAPPRRFASSKHHHIGQRCALGLFAVYFTRQSDDAVQVGMAARYERHLNYLKHC